MNFNQKYAKKHKKTLFFFFTFLKKNTLNARPKNSKNSKMKMCKNQLFFTKFQKMKFSALISESTEILWKKTEHFCEKT